MDIPSWVPLIGTKPLEQDVLAFTEDGSIEKSSIPIVRGYVVDTAENKNKGIFGGIGSAFVLDSEALVVSKESHIAYLPISILSAVPLYVGGVENAKKKNTELNDSMRQIAREALEEELDRVNIENNKDKWSSMLRFVILLFAIFFVIMVIVGLVMAGKVHVPSVGG